MTAIMNGIFVAGNVFITASIFFSDWQWAVIGFQLMAVAAWEPK